MSEFDEIIDDVSGRKLLDLEVDDPRTEAITTDEPPVWVQMWGNKRSLLRTIMIITLVNVILNALLIAMVVGLSAYVYFELIDDVEEEVVEEAEELIEEQEDQLIAYALCEANQACIEIMTLLLGPSAVSACDLSEATGDCDAYLETTDLSSSDLPLSSSAGSSVYIY